MKLQSGKLDGFLQKFASYLATTKTTTLDAEIICKISDLKIII